MNKIKDLLYDKNDILVALLILCIAALIIFTRVNTLMAYPEKMFSGQNSGSGNIYASNPQYHDNNPAVSDHDEEDGAHDMAPDDDTTDLPAEHQPEAHSLYIAYGQSMPSVARSLVELGLFESEQDFTATLEAHNAASKVQTGTFVIPADSTKDEVIKIITGVSR